MTTTQTVKWWGPSWGAPICDPDHEIPVPVGAECARCSAVIDATDQGISLPSGEPIGEPDADDSVLVRWTLLHWDLDCWLESVGIGAARREEKKTSK